MLIDWAQWAQVSLAIKIHVVVAVGGFGLGALVMLTPRGTARHRLLGRGFGILALATAFSSFFIHELRLWGIWSPIHLLSVSLIWVVVTGVVAIRRGNVARHQSQMNTAYLTGFVVAGAFTLIPGRMLNRVFLEGPLDALLPDTWPDGVMFALPVLAIGVAVWGLFGHRFDDAKGFWRRRAD